MKITYSTLGLALCLVLAVLLTGSVLAQALPPLTAMAVTTSNKLISFDSRAPGNILSSVTISGLQGGETVLGIDLRPATGQLYALGSTSRLYTLNPATGAATLVGAGPFAPALSGTQFGFDFNPTVDRIRVVSDADQNLRLHPGTGTVVFTDTVLAYAAGDPNAAANPNAVASAYTNNVAGLATTTLYNLDSNLDILVTQNPPNNGTLNTVGALGVNTSALAGFDIASNGTAFAALTLETETVSKFYTLNLTSGAATLVGPIGGGETIQALTLMDPPVVPMLGLTSSNKLIRFNSALPGNILGSVTISGLQSGEMVLGIDFRPATGQLYALGNSSRLYTVDPLTGVATAVGTGPFTPALSGTEFGFDFNPTVDRIRVVSDLDQNLRLHPNTGAVAGTDTNLAYAVADINAAANPNAVASAYTNNFTGAITTTLYNIDSALNILVTQNPPNAGTLNTVNAAATGGALGVDTSALAGFDIAATGTAFAALTLETETASKFYTLNLSTGATSLVGTIGGTETLRDVAVVPPVANILGVTSGNNLIGFNSALPGNILSSVAISGLQSGETVLGIDFRPATGQLYALGNSSRLYTVDPLTGEATPVGAGPFTPALSGTEFGFDFNPTVDRIRVVSDADQNLRLHPDTGLVAATDTNLAYAAGDPNAAANPNAVASAYTNNFAGATSTLLYNLDSNLDNLVTQNPPNNGTLNTIGLLGANSSALAGFDIAANGTAFAALTLETETASKFYTLNLTTGAAFLVGPIGGTETVRDVTVVPPVANIFGVTTSNKLITFDSTAPGIILSSVTISGLQSGETVLGIDLRPATGQLYALGSSSRLYTLNPLTGAATQIGPAGPFTPALSGGEFGFDFNPTVDRIRVVSDVDQNLRLHPAPAITGTVVVGTDTTLAFAGTDPNAAANPNAIASAYTNNFAGATSTLLYNLDSTLDIVVTQNPPNAGTLNTVGLLGANSSALAGFDIDANGAVFAALTLEGETTSKFYTINLTTGAVTLIGPIGGGETLRDITAGDVLFIFLPVVLK